MLPLERHIIEHLQSFSEKEVCLCVCDEEKSLPLFLREHYALRRMKWMGRDLVLALERPGWEPGSPKQYRAQLQQISAKLDRPLVLVLPSLNASVRNRMVRMRIPFMVPNSQIFLPEIWMDLQEKFPRSALGGRTSVFPPTTQLMLLYHLQVEAIETLTGQELAEKLHCTSAMVSKSREAFQKAGLCELVRVGKTVEMRFLHHGKSLWEKALPYLANPLQKTVWIEALPKDVSSIKAGISALSEISMLADDTIPTLCLHRPVFQGLQQSGQIATCPDSDQAAFRLELWTYNPALLSRNDLCDTLSLWLSLREDPDERVQGELDDVMEAFPWR